MTDNPYEQSLDNYFWLAGEVDRHETPQALALGKLLLEKLEPKSVIDLGCSSGIYLVPYLEAGIEIHGVDGANGVGAHIPGNFEVFDLRQPYIPTHKFDLCLCIETAEHIRPEFSELLVESICWCSDTIFFSAARPGQGGESHLAERPIEEWKGFFSKFGVGIHPKNDEVMGVINSDPVYDYCHWLRWNGVLLGK